jgi:hypothetical protein
MQFVPFEEGIEVDGQAVWALVAGFKAFPVLASTYLLQEGIGTPDPDGVALVDPKAWYSQRAWLKAFEQISVHMGDAVLFEIGRAIPSTARFPPRATDIHSAIQSIDIAYHLNHRKQGQPMFEPTTGAMLEGIGHYGYQRVEGQRQIISVCENPYPCAFDQGILTAMAERFEPSARLVHDETQPCRKHGADSCTYIITWS